MVAMWSDVLGIPPHMVGLHSTFAGVQAVLTFKVPSCGCRTYQMNAHALGSAVYSVVVHAPRLALEKKLTIETHTELGGNSFMAMRILSMLRDVCPAIQVVDIIENDTVQLLAKRMVWPS